MSVLEESAHRLWVGTYGGGVSRLDRATGRFRRYVPDASSSSSLSADRVTALELVGFDTNALAVALTAVSELGRPR
jgi:hypothetical protein